MAGIDPLKVMTDININAYGTVAKALSTTYNGSALGGTFGSGDTMWKIGKFSVYLDEYAVNPTELIKIDNFFTRFGYAQNKIMQPNTATRPYFTYLKTGDSCYINNGVAAGVSHGHANALQIAKINALLRKGVTFWTTTTTKDNIFKYDTLDNSPAT